MEYRGAVESTDVKPANGFEIPKKKFTWQIRHLPARRQRPFWKKSLAANYSVEFKSYFTLHE
ncbi:uncharacterized protein TrAFT101_001511 [Trichoderma asperellum]|uniref:uncharacterized protein n=1 Tax=Trichoderma asperellum TaxID=101201 RepID=UPI003329E896|nr:hypothetical protein TrAFT101_001511 [Trichoderma asperellum]